MIWQIGFKVLHPLNVDWGVGEVIGIGNQQRNIEVTFPGLEDPVILSTERAVFKRFIFPPGSHARFEMEGEPREIIELEEAVGIHESGEAQGFILYKTTDGKTVDERYLAAISLPSGPAERLIRLDAGDLTEYENRYAGVVLAQERQAQGLGGVLGGRIRLFPHQLYVAKRLIRMLPIRALLADEVGLGKTIEAGMVFSALRQAGRADRVLVLTPSSLTVQWMGELYRKFHVVFTLLDKERMEDVKHAHPNLTAFEVHSRVVMDLDYFATSGLIKAAAELEGGWDLIIVDEAHHLQWDEDGGNEAYQAVASVLKNARSVLFLTATPMELDRQEYFALLRLLHPTLFPDEALFQRQLEDMGRANKILMALGQVEATKGDIPELAPRDVPLVLAKTFPHSPHLHELGEAVAEGTAGAVSDLVDALTWLHPLGELVISNRRERVGGFQPRTVQRVRVTLDRERHLLYGDVLSLLKELIDLAPDDLLGPALSQAARTLRTALGSVSALAVDLSALARVSWAKPLKMDFQELALTAQGMANQEDPKLGALIHLIRAALDQNEKTLIFVESVASVKALHSRIEARTQVRCAVFHEGLSPKDRDLQVSLFKNPEGYPVLISTESGGEGRNFQFCHRLIHFDLPWEPSRIEQRIGRLDRIGQSQEVQSTVFACQGTVEANIVALLDEQVGVFRQTVGGMEPVLEGIGSAIRELVFSDEGENPKIWNQLSRGVAGRLSRARDAVTQGLDHLLHRAGYDPALGESLTTALPDDFDERLEEFSIEFCEQVGISIHERDQSQVFALELGRYFKLEGLAAVDHGALYVGSFDRETAVEREDIDFFATGHPLIEGIFAHLEDSEYGTVALRRYKTGRYRKGMGVQFNFLIASKRSRFADISAFFEPKIEAVAVNLDGTLRPDLIPLLTARYSQAEAMEPQELVDHRDSFARAVRNALKIAKAEAKRLFQQASDEAQQALEIHAEQEEERESTYFNYQLGQIQAYMEEFPEHSDVLEEEGIALLNARNHARSERLEMSIAMGEGEAILDSVAFFLVEPRRGLQ